MQAVCLGTKATFSYMPTVDEQKKFIALQLGKRADALKHHVLTDEEKKSATNALIEAENEQLITNRKTAGDASESGLIKFIQPIFDLEDYRRKYPVYHYEQDGKPTET